MGKNAARAYRRLRHRRGALVIAETTPRRLISLLVPIYNEETLVEIVLDRFHKLAEMLSSYDFQFFFVDDGSTDNTFALIKQAAEKDSRIDFIQLSRNFGQETAIMAGIDRVAGDAMVIVDADLQDPPELIPAMVEAWEQGYQDIYGRRRTRQDNGLRKIAANVYYRILENTSELPTQPGTGYFRLLDRKCILALRQIRESNRYLRGMMSWIGFRKLEVLYDRDPRTIGSSKWAYSKLINLAINGLTSSTTKPLRLATWFGASVSLSAFVFVVVVVIRALVGDPSLLTGWPSLMAVILFIGGVQLLCLGVIGEYIARIFTETKQRPTYLVNEESIHAY